MVITFSYLFLLLTKSCSWQFQPFMFLLAKRGNCLVIKIESEWKVVFKHTDDSLLKLLTLTLSFTHNIISFPFFKSVKLLYNLSMYLLAITKVLPLVHVQLNHCCRISSAAFCMNCFSFRHLCLIFMLRRVTSWHLTLPWPPHTDRADGPSPPGHSGPAAPDAGPGGIRAAADQRSVWGRRFLSAGVCR